MCQMGKTVTPGMLARENAYHGELEDLRRENEQLANRVARLTEANERVDEQPDGDPHGECAAEIHRLENVIRRAANIMRGGEGVEDQGEAWDRTQRLLDEAVADMTPNVDVTGPRLRGSGGQEGSASPSSGD